MSGVATEAETTVRRAEPASGGKLMVLTAPLTEIYEVERPKEQERQFISLTPRFS
jgi:hypothetical protein